VILLLRKLRLRLQLSPPSTARSPDIRAWRAVRGARAVLRIRRDRFFRADGGARRSRASAARRLHALAALYRSASPKRAAVTAEVFDAVSDLQFTSRYRVPFQFSRLRARALQGRQFSRILVRRDGHRSRRQSFYDLTGSYGVNVFGYDFYKDCIARGSERVRELGRCSAPIIRSSPTT
jgi:glutamate-1-semialdehyde 2,1-aminomutase